jgi:hypothetical protein
LAAIRRRAAAHGAIVGISHRFTAPGIYWADVVMPGYGTVATGRTELEAATAAISQFDGYLATWQ